HGAFDGKDHVVRLERRAVMKFHVLAQGEAPYGGAGLLPSSGQTRYKFEFLVVLNQRFVYVAGSRDGQPFVLCVGIKCQDIALTRPMKRLSLGRQRQKQGGGHSRGE